MKESKNIGQWSFQDSALCVLPEILIEQAKSRNDPLVTALLANNNGNDGDDLAPQEGILAASLLLSRIELLLSTDDDDVERQSERDQLLHQLADAGISTTSPTELTNILQTLRNSIFHQKIRYATCHPFPPELAMLIDLSFLPDEFFDPTSHTEMSKHYTEMVGNPKSEIGSFRESMHWSAAQNFGCRFQFAGHESNTDAFVSVLDYFLEKYGGKDNDGGRYSSPSLRDDWSLGFLSTVLERLQDPHMDYGHERLAQYKQMAGRKSRNKQGEVLLPWSFDMPLTEGGLRLAFWGIDDPDDASMLLDIPVELYVPPKHVMLWRGDCIHAGSLLDKLGRSGFRMHGCLPLASAHVGCGKDAGAKIEWHGPSSAGKKAEAGTSGTTSSGTCDGCGGSGADRRRYSQRLKKLDGTPFEADDEVRYAADVVEKIGLRQSTVLWKLRNGETTKKARLS